MGEVVKIYPAGSAKNPDLVLEQAIGVYDSILMLGYDREGNLDVRASTNLYNKSILWLVDSFRHKLLNGDYEED